MTWTPSHHSLRLLTAAGLSVVVAGAFAACRTAQEPTPHALATQAAAPGSPMLVHCAPGQQPLIRQVAVNGAWVPQVECVVAGAMQQTPQQGAPAAPGHGQATAYAPAQAYHALAPVHPQAQAPLYAPAPQPVVYEQRVPAARPAARRVVYDDDVVEYRSPTKGRTWQKSAIIIGSSAGVGAGVGAATGGKKGALIGAAIGGGAATIWDQSTRR